MKFTTFLFCVLFALNLSAQNWIQIEPDGLGVSYGVGEAPEGAEVFEDEKSFQKAIETAEADVEKSILSFESEVDKFVEEAEKEKTNNGNNLSLFSSNIRLQELQYIKSIATSWSRINSAYNKTKATKRPFSLVEVAKFPEIAVDVNKENGKIDTAANIAKRIFEKLK